MRRSAATVDRFLRSIRKTESCWIWIKSTRGKDRQNGRGYGAMWDGTSYVSAHRWAYEHFVGPIPAGMEIDHVCNVTRCVRPDHLRPLDGRSNVLRGNGPAARHARQVDCIHGHPLRGANLAVRRDRKGRSRRVCMECARRRGLAYFHRKTRGARALEATLGILGTKGARVEELRK